VPEGGGSFTVIPLAGNPGRSRPPAGVANPGRHAGACAPAPDGVHARAGRHVGPRGPRPARAREYRRTASTRLHDVHGNRRRLMAVDRPTDDDPEETSGSLREKQHEQGKQPADGTSAWNEIAETRSPAEYYRALRAAVDQQARTCDSAGASADTSPRSAWDNADALTRPPLDALRMPPERVIHILDGDATGGGHRYGTGKPGKTEFPASWDDDKITESILSVARLPDSASLQRNGRWKVEGVHDEVKLAVIIMADGRIWSAYPLPGSPGVIQNPRNR
jgi:Bacterial EndoU nuclease